MSEANPSAAVVFQYVPGDNLPLLFGRHSEDITGFTLTLRVEQPDTTVVSIVGVIDNAPTGDFHFGPFPGTFFVPGLQRAQIELTDGSGDSVTTTNMFINVTGEI